MIGPFASRQFLTFLITGAIAATVNFSSRIVFSFWFNFSVSVVLAYLVGMATAFVLAKKFVFKDSSHSLHRSALFFTLVNVFAAFQTWLVSVVLLYYILPAIGVKHFSEEIAHGIGVVFPIFSSYLGHKRWSFG